MHINFSSSTNPANLLCGTITMNIGTNDRDHPISSPINTPSPRHSPHGPDRQVYTPHTPFMHTPPAYTRSSHFTPHFTHHILHTVTLTAHLHTSIVVILKPRFLFDLPTLAVRGIVKNLVETITLSSKPTVL